MRIDSRKVFESQGRYRYWFYDKPQSGHEFLVIEPGVGYWVQPGTSRLDKSNRRTSIPGGDAYKFERTGCAPTSQLLLLCQDKT